MRFLAVYIMRGRMQAVMVASTLALLSLLMPLLSVLSLAAIALVTLRHGIKEGLLVWLIAAIVTALLGILLFANGQFALAYTVLQWLPVWLIATTFRITQEMARAIEAAVTLGIVIVVIFYSSVSDPAGFWLALLNDMVKPLFASMGDAGSDEKMQYIERASHFMTGMVAAGSIFGLLLGLMLARWWQAQLFNPGGFGQEFTSIKTSPKFAIATLVIIVTAMITDGTVSELAWNIGVPILVLYTFIGAAIVHALLVASKHAKVMMLLFYGIMMVLVLMNPLVLMPIAFAGISDTWLNLRARISNKNNQQ